MSASRLSIEIDKTGGPVDLRCIFRGMAEETDNQLKAACGVLDGIAAGGGARPAVSHAEGCGGDRAGGWLANEDRREDELRGGSACPAIRKILVRSSI